eukprot:jgi/Bigna1/144114/aug1.84_g18822
MPLAIQAQIAAFAEKYVPGSYKDIVDGKKVIVGQGKNKSLKVDEELHTRIKALAKKNKMSMQQFTTKILMDGIYGMEP